MYTIAGRILLTLQNVLTSLTPMDAMGSEPTVIIPAGVVVGTTLSPTSQPSVTAVANAYLGVPYAKSPPERFSRPEEHEPWPTSLYAQRLPPSCMQQPLGNSSADGTAYQNKQEDEDCLYLNVYTPQDASPSDLKEVMFWIHGGFFQIGSSADPTIDGTSFAVNQGVIIVTINYRLGMFGFSNSPEMPLAERNLAFLDQRFALDWVHQNIHHFGGDPTKVTIFGESAGGGSVRQLLAAPPDPLPFRAAIMESESTSFRINASENGEKAYKNVSDHFNCRGINCLRNLPACDLRDYVKEVGLTFPPTEDNETFVANVTTSIDNGGFAKVPFVIGTNKDELSHVVASLKSKHHFVPATTALRRVLESQFGVTTDRANEITEDLKEILGHKLHWRDIVRLTSDMAFGCTSGAIANYTVQHGWNVWRYRYSAGLTNESVIGDLGACHTSEIPEVFGTYFPGNATEQMVSLSQYIQTAWARFAKDPQAGPGWDPVVVDGRLGLADLGNNGSAGEIPITFWEADEYCSFLFPYADELGLAW